MNLTIYNSKDKVQKKLHVPTREIAMLWLDSTKGKEGWYAVLIYKDGDREFFYCHNKEWCN